jgi:cytidylate kinase
MENLLQRYLDMRVAGESRTANHGPVVTISREYGCPSKILAEMLVTHINQVHHQSGKPGPLWRWVSKELLEQAASELKVQPRDITHVYNYEERSWVDDLLAATKKDGSYRSDRAIRNAIGKVIRSYGESGNVVIVGRAGMAVTRQIPLSLHIRLIAPLEWRVARISEVYKLSREDALGTIRQKDENRRKFLEFFLGHEFRFHDFDAIFNCATLNLEEIMKAIEELMGSKKLL